MHRLYVLLLIVITGFTAQAQEKYPDGFLPQHLTEEEKARLHEIFQEKSTTDPPAYPVRSIAEFEPMSGALIRYPLGIPYSLVALMSEEVEVVSIVAGQSVKNQAISEYQSHGVNMDNASFIIAPTNSIWTRDYGPWYVFDGNDEFGIVDFQYDRPRPNDNAIPSIFANEYDYNYYHMGLIHTGGDFMSTGMGTGASTNAVYNVNSSLAPAAVDSIMDLYLGIDDYHVVPNIHGGLSHIDTWAKFLAPDKIMIREVDSSHPYYHQAEQAVDYFESQTSSYGSPFTVYRVYTPNDEPYTNSLILNDNVYVPTTGSPHDDDAIAAYEEAMPGYTVHGIYYSGWWSTDALHCRVREIADSEMLYIHHMPIVEDQQAYHDYTIEARIIPKSGETLYTDSIKVHYQINGGDFSGIVMTAEDDHWFSAEIPQQDAGAEIAYYISAADASGRNENHPFIGPYDPHRFTITGPELAIFEGQITLSGGEAEIQEVLISADSLQTNPDESGWYALQVPAGTYTLTAELTNHTPYSTEPITVSAGDTIATNIALQYMYAPENLSYDLAGNDLILSWSHDEPPPTTAKGNPMKGDDKALTHFNIYRSFEYDAFVKAGTSETTAYTDSGLDNGMYRYFVTAVYDATHESQPSDTLTTDIAVAAEAEVLSSQTGLTRVFPNPFSQEATISFSLQVPSDVKIGIYNLSGIKVASLVNATYSSGSHTVSWNGRDSSGRTLPGGVYVVRFTSPDHTESKNIVLQR